MKLDQHKSPQLLNYNTTIRNNQALAHLKVLEADVLEHQPRVYVEGKSLNNTLYKESAVQAKVNVDLKFLRTKAPFSYDRVPVECVEQYSYLREEDQQREQYLVNRRFPELEQAREAFLGQEVARSPLKNQHAYEIEQYSEGQYKLACKSDPFLLKKGLSAKKSHKKMVTIQDDKLRTSTLTHSLKHKYIARSRHSSINHTHFDPPNPTQARETIECKIKDSGDVYNNFSFDQGLSRSSYNKNSQKHKQNPFKASSPVTQDIFRATPKQTLNMDNTYSGFLQTNSQYSPQRSSFEKLDQMQHSVKFNQKSFFLKEDSIQSTAANSIQNPRAQVLENFKEISRIITQNFLNHKTLEKRYDKNSLPPSEYARIVKEEAAQQRMTGIMKKMYDTSTFSAPCQFLPNMSHDSVILRGGRDTFNQSIQKRKAYNPDASLFE